MTEILFKVRAPIFVRYFMRNQNGPATFNNVPLVAIVYCTLSNIISLQTAHVGR